MSKQNVLALVLAALLLAAALPGGFIAGQALAQSGDEYELLWSSVDGGGGTVGDGEYELSGTFGQPEVAPALTDGDYELVGGFWPGAGTARYRVYLPILARDWE